MYLYLSLYRWYMKYLNQLLNSKKTVFTYSDIVLLLWITNMYTVKSFFIRWVKEWIFIQRHKWIYTLQDYDIYEFASKLKKQSYISFETILKREWIIFQDYGNTIFLASDNTITKQVDTHSFTYLKIKDSILTNPLWLINKGTYTIATPERAICDRLYLSSDYYFDNIDDIDYDVLASISLIYNKRVILAVQSLIAHAQHR